MFHDKAKRTQQGNLLTQLPMPQTYLEWEIQMVWYVNVSDQTAIFTHKTKMLILICWKCFLAFNVLNMTKTAGWIQNFKKKRRNSPKKTVPFLLHYCDNLCTSDGSDGTQKWPWAPWQWVGMTFQVFMGSSGAQIAFTILLATSIGKNCSILTQCTAYDRGTRQCGWMLLDWTLLSI